MGTSTVEKFATELGLPIDLLLEQLKSAGVNKAVASDELIEADKTVIVIEVAPPNCEPLSENVMTSPAVWPEPPFVIVIVGVDEPSKITLAVVPVPEPSVPVCVIS